MGIVKFDRENNSLIQFFEGLDFKEAYHQVTTLRVMNDGNSYWIGKAENHLGLLK